MTKVDIESAEVIAVGVDGLSAIVHHIFAGATTLLLEVDRAGALTTARIWYDMEEFLWTFGSPLLDELRAEAIRDESAHGGVMGPSMLCDMTPRERATIAQFVLAQKA